MILALIPMTKTALLAPKKGQIGPKRLEINPFRPELNSLNTGNAMLPRESSILPLGSLYFYRIISDEKSQDVVC